jgi:hypothetical protein
MVTRPRLRPIVTLLGLALTGCPSGDVNSSSATAPAEAEPSAPLPTPEPTVDRPAVEVRADDYIRGGAPYVAPTIEDGRFRCSREYARGQGFFPVSFSVAVPPGMEVMETERDATSNNVVAFVTRSDGKIVRYFGIGVLGYHDATTSLATMASMEAKIIPDIGEQFAAQLNGRSIDQKRVMMTGLDHDVHRVDLLDLEFEHDDFQPGRWTGVAFTHARRDGRPHGVLFTAMMHESIVGDVDALLKDPQFDGLLRSFEFE